MCFKFNSFITVIKCFFYMLSLGCWYSQFFYFCNYVLMSCLHAYTPKWKRMLFALECSSLDKIWLIYNHGAIQCNIHLFSVNSFIFVIINNYFSNMTWTQWFLLKIKVCFNSLFVASDRNLPTLTKQWEFITGVRSSCGCLGNPRSAVQLGFWNRPGPETQAQG